MNIKNKGYIVPVAIGILVVASLGLLLFSWWGRPSNVDDGKSDIVSTLGGETDLSTLGAQSKANDEVTLNIDSANLDAQLKALDDSDVDINNSLNDTSSI